MRFKKKAQGVSAGTQFQLGQYQNSEEELIGGMSLKLNGSLAASRGKFARNVIQGIEGNQGPYRLNGANNETFIIVLSGTERVFIDGLLLQRGQEFDYTINYNTAEVIFTANRLITKDKRITIEFQYSDKNYARFINYGGAELSGEKLQLSLDFYNEFDSKNQPLQLNLDDEDRFLLSTIGDDLNAALIPSIDSVAFDNDYVLYALVDSLGYDSVLVYSTNPDSARYQVAFSSVGANNGDYQLDDFTANGRVYQWIAPDTSISGEIIPQGSYAPIIQLVTPKKQQLISAEAKYRFSEGLLAGIELAASNYDENTFSKLDDQNNVGAATRAWVEHLVPLQKTAENPWQLDSRLEGELIQSRFKPIERELFY